MTRFGLTLAAAGLALATAAIADDGVIALEPLKMPDPATVTVPALPLTFGSKERVDADSLFYFHKQGVSYQTAFADLDQCRLYAQSAMLFAQPPKFVPLGTGAIRRDPIVPNTDFYYNQYGIVGGMTASIIFAVVVTQVSEDNRNATARRCMAFKGYRRYGLSSAAAGKIDTGTEAEKQARRALIAAGPVPQAQEAGQ
jgi:hypothetical protein